ncbi:MAG: sensor domain-containing diguanylate cyclase [Lacrimispora sp.]|uniref:sensor domain-containing diguanylate cyclase n=1 Tax=Lacrimispora sp. TaxID=2719234 RepID=UPI0039E63CD6
MNRFGGGFKEVRDTDFQFEDNHYRLLFENCMDAMLLTSVSGEIYRANPAACKLFGKTEEELCKGGRAAIVDLGDPRVVLAARERNKTGSTRSELTFIKCDGSKFLVECTSAIFRDEKGFVLTVMTFRDITSFRQREEDLIRSQEEMTFLATYDYLTGAFNRGSFVQKLKADMEDAYDRKTAFSLLLVDIDYFKQINDKYGHPGGDVTLKRLVECIHTKLEAYDYIGRLGGDEFVVCLPDTDMSEAADKAEQMRKAVEALNIYFNSHLIKITISVGIAQYEMEIPVDTDAFISKADNYLYQAKAKRNCVVSE